MAPPVRRRSARNAQSGWSGPSALVVNSLRQLSRQPGLANPGLAAHQSRLTLAGAGGLPQLGEALEFGGPTHEHRTHACHKDRQWNLDPLGLGSVLLWTWR